MLACISNRDKSGQLSRMVNGTELSVNIHKAMLVHNDLQTHVAVLDQENIDISSKKPPHQLLI